MLFQACVRITRVPVAHRAAGREAKQTDLLSFLDDLKENTHTHTHTPHKSNRLSLPHSFHTACTEILLNNYQIEDRPQRGLKFSWACVFVDESCEADPHQLVGPELPHQLVHRGFRPTELLGRGHIHWEPPTLLPPRMENPHVSSITHEIPAPILPPGGLCRNLTMVSVWR